MGEITVCISTVDRPEQVADAIASVLGQEGAVPQVLVIHQGEATAAAELAAAWRHRPEVRVLHQDRLGLSASRNLGLESATTEWVGFLDDDDRLLPGWSTILGRHLGDGVGVVSCSAEVVDPAGRRQQVTRSDQEVPLVGNVLGLHLAGCWVARRTILDAVGGYLPGIACSHQTELWIRLTSALVAQGLRAEHDVAVGTRITTRPPGLRAMASPRVQFDGGRWLAVRHREHLAADRSHQADAHGAVGVSAARLERWHDARAATARAARSQPTDPRRWARLALTCCPPLARRVWGTEPTPEPTSLPRVRELARNASADGGELDPLLFLPYGYRTNPARSADTDGTPFWTPDAPTGGNDVRFQDPVYRWAARLLRRGDVDAPVVDIGCGSGHKLIHRIAPVTDRWLGVDQPSGIATASRTFPQGNWLAADLAADAAWESIGEHRPGLVLCADVIEHLSDPYSLLDRLRALAGPDGLILLSTPDRARLDDPQLGPPGNPRHVREWSHAEMRLLLDAARLEVVAERHLLPRRYSPTVLELKRTVHRALHGRAVPDRRSCMAFLLRAAR